MTEPTDVDQIPNALASQEAIIGRHEELLRGLMEGFQTMAERHDQALDTLREQFRGLSTRQPTPTVTSQPLSNPVGSSAVTPVSREPLLPSLECFDRESGTCRAFLNQCSLVMKLQPFSLSLDCSKIAYLITLISLRATAF